MSPTVEEVLWGAPGKEVQRLRVKSLMKELYQSISAVIFISVYFFNDFSMLDSIFLRLSSGIYGILWYGFLMGKVPGIQTWGREVKVG